MSRWDSVVGISAELFLCAVQRFGRCVDQACNIVLELRQFLRVQIDHVAGIVILERNVAAKRSWQVQMVHREFGSEEWGGHVEQSIFRLHLQPRVTDQGFDEIPIDANPERIRTFMLPVPFGWDVSILSLIRQVGIEF
jgi:hypothetical protein